MDLAAGVGGGDDCDGDSGFVGAVYGVGGGYRVKSYLLECAIFGCQNSLGGVYFCNIGLTLCIFVMLGDLVEGFCLAVWSGVFVVQLGLGGF